MKLTPEADSGTSVERQISPTDVPQIWEFSWTGFPSVRVELIRVFAVEIFPAVHGVHAV